MTTKLTMYVLLCVLFTLVSCGLMYERPETVFQTLGLNGNKIPHDFQRHFREIRQHKANGTLQIVGEDNKTMKQSTCLAYIEYVYKRTFESDIANIKNMKVADEAKPILTAGLKTFEYADALYKNDFPIIAKMIDEGKTDHEIDSAIDNLDATKGVELDKLYTEMMDLLIPYAQRHGVEYKAINMP